MSDLMKVKVEMGSTIRFLDQLGALVPKAESVALNRTAEWGTKFGRDRAPDNFQIRSQQALRWAFPVTIPGKERATPNRLWTAIEPDRIGKVFAPFETGTPHTIDRLGRLVAIPSTGFYGARRTPSSLIPKNLFPHNLGLVVSLDASGKTYFALGRGSKKKGLSPIKVSAAGKVTRKGKLRTFQIQGKKGPVILQRMGPGEHDIRTLWHLRPVVRRPKVLHYFDSIERAAKERWQPEMLAAFEYFERIASTRAK